MPKLVKPLARAPAATAAQSESLETYVNWFFLHCLAKNLAAGTMRFYRQKLCYLVAAYGDATPDIITLHNLRQLVVSLKTARAWSVSQTNCFIRAVRTFFNYLEHEELILTNPARRLEKLREEVRFPDVLSKAQIQALLEATAESFAGFRDRAIILTLLDTGLRLSELFGMTLESVDFQSLQIRVFGKGRKERFVPFSATLGKLLVKYKTLRGHAESNAFWVNKDGKPLTPSYFVNFLRIYSRRAGINPSVHPHRFRHTFATEFLRNGGSPLTLQRILGHTTQAMTARYTHLTDTDAAASHRTASPLEGFQRQGLNARAKRR